MTIKTDNIQIGLDAVANNNTTLSITNGTFKLSSGIPSALGQDYMSFNPSAITFSTFITEGANILATAPAATQNYSADKAIIYHTANSSTNFVMNFASLANVVNGSSGSYVILVTNGSTGYFSNTIQIGGTTTGVTTKWQGGVPTSGNTNKVDVYNISIIKTSANTYSVFAAQTNFG